MSKRSCGLRWLLGYPALLLAALLLAVTAPAAESFDKFGPRSIQAIVSADLMLLDGYNDQVSPIVSIERFNRLVLAHDQTGKAIVIAPIDYMIWNERVASVTEEMAKRMQLSPGGNKFELWIIGTASPLFKGEAEARGIRAKDHVSAVLPLLD